MAETVFSHESKLELVATARRAGYLTTLHVILVPEALSVERVALRVKLGGHSVPEEKVRSRYRRLWRLLRGAIGQVDSAVVLDNSRARRPFRPVARYRRGELLGEAEWPSWTPVELRSD